MTGSLYIGTNGNATGKRMVTLGMMELASRRFGRVTFFRPVVRRSANEDLSIRLMRTRYGLTARPEQMVGLTRSEARQMLADDRVNDLIQIIQMKFKSLESESDFVVVEGTSFQGLAPEFEFELNADIAVNLGCRVLAVYALGERTVKECVESVLIGNDTIKDHGAELFATIINQVPIDQSDALRTAYVSAGLGTDSPVYLLPEVPSLRQPTIREIQAGLGATLVSGDERALDREVAKLKVAAMMLPGFLERLSHGSLVMTPGDRVDILLGCILACLQPDGPRPAGIVLTGGVPIPVSVQRLIGPVAALPILACKEDTYTVASRAAEVRAEISEHSPRKIASALGVFETSIDVEDLAIRLQAPSAHRITPMLFEHSLIERARQQRVTIVLPEGTEPRILQAVDVLRRRDVANLILLGSASEIAAAASKVGLMLPQSGVEIIDPATSELREGFAEKYFQLRKHKGMTLDVALDRMQDATYFGTMMVHCGLAGGLVSGAVHTTANTIRPAFEFIKTRPNVNTVSSVFLMCLKDGVLVYGDCAVIPNPTADQLAEIAISSSETAIQFGIEPRIAMLSYSTGESGQGVDVDKVRQATATLRSRRPDLMVEGPLQYDAAVDPSVAATKMPGNAVAGRATVLIFPDLNTGNNLYKAVQRSAGATAIGPILQGLNRPVNDLSRGCTVTDIVNTVAITAIQAQVANPSPVVSSNESK
jgi:phosphate acetyltransferase